jgi:hypothetical protein
MRTELAKIFKVRDRFTARFEKYGSRVAYKGPPLKTLLFLDVRRRGELVTDHLWFTSNKAFEQLDMKPGDQISFNARVKTYSRGRFGQFGYDYKLSNPTKVVLHQENAPGLLF